MAGLIHEFRKVRKLFRSIREIYNKVDDLQQAIGRVELYFKLQERSYELQDYEVKIYSQWGEDGIIQYLIRQVEVPNKVFIEFGVQDYRESNTRFLLLNDNWSGLIMDASKRAVEDIKRDRIYGFYDLQAVCSFINRDNINDLILKSGISGDIGLLSIDIDGNDYWIWDAINCISPRIVICEYNSTFGWQKKVTIPYKADFDRTKAHFSNLYFGASIAALDQLGKKKGYCLLGSNSAGNNLFFIRHDIAGDLTVLSPREVYIKAKFRESRDMKGKNTFLGFQERSEVIADLPLYDLDLDTTIKVRNLVFDE